MRFGKVRFGELFRQVCLEYEPEAGPGDYVLVHVGFAIASVDPEEAARTWEALRELGQLDELQDSALDTEETPT